MAPRFGAALAAPPLLAYHIRMLRPPGDAKEFREDFLQLLALRRERKIHPVIAERLPLSEARRAHELWSSAHPPESSFLHLRARSQRRDAFDPRRCSC